MVRFKFIDIIFVLAALAVSVLFIIRPEGERPKKLLLMHGDRNIALPYTDGIIDLKKYTGKDMELEVKGGKARMVKSTCPDKICINGGWADSCGHIIICMPNSVAVMIDCTGALDETK